jgi:hypothetical protein
VRLGGNRNRDRQQVGARNILSLRSFWHVWLLELEGVRLTDLSEHAAVKVVIFLLSPACLATFIVLNTLLSSIVQQWVRDQGYCPKKRQDVPRP